MHVKFLEHGTGSGRAAARYLLQDRDHTGAVRAAVEILHGDPVLVGIVADRLEQKHRYTSGVIAWAPDDAPTEAQIDAVLADFEKVAFAGLAMIDRDGGARFAWSAVLHRDHGGGCHVHILAARIDLQTGLAFNPAPPGWQRAFDPLCAAWNYEQGWARPDDPARRRVLKPDWTELASAAEMRAGLAVEPDPKASITQWLTYLVERGKIADRADIETHLGQLGEITRRGKKYITVRLAEGPQRPLRFKGGIYNEAFDAAAVRERRSAAEEARRAAGPGGEDHQSRAREARVALQAEIERRASYNLGRYGATDTGGPEAVPAAAPPRSRARPDGEGRVKTQTRQEAADELEEFKTSIQLTEFLSADGWTQDLPESTRGYGVMRRGEDKIIVHQRANGHQAWVRPRSPDSGGTILDYCKQRWGETLGYVRQRLRRWLGRPAEPSPADWEPVTESKPDLVRVRIAWEAAEPVGDPPGWLLERGLTAQTLAAYGEGLRLDGCGQLLTAHRQMDGRLSGCELKGPAGPGRFAAGGQKGIGWLFAGSVDALRRIVIVETALDALSLAQMEGHPADTAYVSTAGNPSEEQLAALEVIAGGCERRGGEVLLGQDADEGGDRQAARIAARLRPIETTRLRPEGAGVKDWNDLLQLRRLDEPDPAPDPVQPAPSPKPDPGPSPGM